MEIKIGVFVFVRRSSDQVMNCVNKIKSNLQSKIWFKAYDMLSE